MWLLKIKIGDGKPFKGDKVDIEDWAEFSEDPIFVEECQKMHNNQDIPEANDVQGNSLEDTYLNMELSLPKHGNKKNQMLKSPSN